MLHKSIPVLKEYIWAGTKLKSKYHKITDLEKVSESFEYSINTLGESRIDSMFGELTMKRYLDLSSPGENLRGSLPNLLIKLIDSDDNLSVQVHPSDEYAFKKYEKNGKTEMWYILEASEGASIYLGFNDDYSRDDVEKALKEGTILNLLNKYEVKRGEFYRIPSGTIHAIGKGVTLYEIQEDSDLTFRLYDYDRVGKDGKKRELHIEESLEVLNYSKYVRNVKKGKTKGIEILAANKYFELMQVDIHSHYTLYNNKNSFEVVTVISGEPELDGNKAKLGDSFYIDPETNIKVEGECSLLIARIPRLYMGLDVGGTSIKGIVIDDLGNKVSEVKIPTEFDRGYETVLNHMADAAISLAKDCDTELSFFENLGIGFPGTINHKDGIVVFSNNLKIKNAHVKEDLEKILGINVILDNDANCAALGEYMFTDKKKYHDMVLITLGTGLGSGVIINKELFRGGQGMVTELGHLKIKSDNHQCTCGQYGCAEAQVSLARLHEDVEKLRKDPQTGLSEIIKEDASPIEIFKHTESNEASKSYTFKYLNNIVSTLVNVANMLEPEIICIGGGISYPLRKFIPYIEKRLNLCKFAGMDAPYIKVVPAELGNEAGGYGACALGIK